MSNSYSPPILGFVNSQSNSDSDSDLNDFDKLNLIEVVSLKESPTSKSVNDIKQKIYEIYGKNSIKLKKAIVDMKKQIQEFRTSEDYSSILTNQKEKKTKEEEREKIKIEKEKKTKELKKKNELKNTTNTLINTLNTKNTGHFFKKMRDHDQKEKKIKYINILDTEIKNLDQEIKNLDQKINTLDEEINTLGNTLGNEEKKLIKFINKPEVLITLLNEVLNEIELTKKKKITSVYSAKEINQPTSNPKNIGPPGTNQFAVSPSANEIEQKFELYEQWKKYGNYTDKKKIEEIQRMIKEYKQHIQYIKEFKSKELKGFNLESENKYKKELNDAKEINETYLNKKYERDITDADHKIKYLDYVRKRLNSEINESESNSEYLEFVNGRLKDPEHLIILDKFGEGGSKKKNKRSKTKRSKTKRSKTKRSKTKRSSSLQ
jgi:hypothetical protein